MRMKRIKRVGIDLDNTVVDYMTGAIPLLKEHYGLEPNFNVKAHKIEEVFGLTRETRPEGLRKHLYEDLHLFKTLPPIEGMSDTVFCIYTMGVKIYFITARNPSPIIREDTQFWLSNNNFVYDDIFHVDQKSKLCKMMDVSVMIEDEAGQIEELVEAGIDVVVFDQPWNRHLTVPEYKPEQGRIKRVYNAGEVFFAVKEFLQ